MHAYRTHTCGELRKKDVGTRARLSGWVNRRRDHGGLIFIDLRDHYGITQCVVEPDSPAFATVDKARSEWVLTFTGHIEARTEDTINPDMPTGEIELRIDEASVQGTASDLPVPVFGDLEYPEETRLKYRFLDLRREKLHKNIILRSKIISSVRRRMIDQGFMEYQTPILTASSPEGARDFLVPSRLHPGKFYALPQAPQQFKQLLMVAGFDRYFQIAPCFRDEDARADRSPGEFYQLDIEMSFVTQDDVFAAVEPVLHGVFEEFAEGRKVSPAPFVRIPYEESMLKYGVDKPDLRNPLIIADVGSVFDREDVAFKAFKNKTVRAVPAPGAASQPRSWYDKLEAWAKTEQGAAGLGYIVFEDKDGVLTGKGPIAKFLPPEAQAELAKIVGLKAGDAVFFSANAKKDRAAALAGQVRIKLGRDLGLIDDSKFEFCWIVDFPMYEWNEDEKKIDFSHNPFSMPQFDREKFLALDPADQDTILGIKAFQYDIVCNGIELSSGAIRNHDPDVMLKAFEIAGYKREETEVKFAGMLNAFRYGAPPHGGTAPGIDRMVMLLAGVDNLREIILFPMNQRAEDLMMNAPSEATLKQLRELHIRVVKPEKE
ncbi:aspartate--tRNA ligase [Rhizomicrobium electricum]|uniref:Aspartate--tRNA(Asp/Asn) ligase n=1 Tax=Rhizomicrobium electricum TaxID=480070 RepID=A0ABP3P572_9PROT|nr:aspartate--tRNA ligase [Rhizomicrobium electricum]NIJ47352.1 aspartyl-tRNA synthetase [Rhizomicrobium electricum]